MRFLEQLSLSPGALQLTAPTVTTSNSRPATAMKKVVAVAAAAANTAPAAGSDVVAAGAAAAAGQQESLVQRIAKLCVEVHKSVEAAAERLFVEVKRR